MVASSSSSLHCPFFFLFFLLLVVSSSSSSSSSSVQDHHCIHGSLVEQYVTSGVSPAVVKQEHIIADGPTSLFTQNLRIFINYDNIFDDIYTCYKEGDTVIVNKTDNSTHTCRSGDVLNEEKYLALISLLQDARSFFLNALTVIPISGNLKINSSLTYQSYCDVRIDPVYEWDGVPNAEYILFVTSRPSVTDATLAYARYCQTDDLGQSEGRPIVGTVNFAPFSIDLSKEGRVSQLGIVIHEISHALGFSYSKFSKGFVSWQWTGSSWERSNVGPDQIMKTYFNPDIGHQVTLIITPNTASAARVHFGCPGLDGAELEDGGGQGTSLSHWEQRVFRNEYMTGTSTPYPVYSNITLSLFKDMGWYNVSLDSNFTRNLDPFLWGKNMGCSFVNGSCAHWPLTTAKEGYRCTTDSSKGQCRFDLKGWGQCNIALPRNPLDDGCTFYESSVRTSCSLDTKFFKLTMDAGEVHNDEARCFHSTVARFPSILNSFLRTSQGNSMQCYRTTCAGPTQAKIQVEGVWYDCPYQGGEIYPINFGGSITCHPQVADILCSKYPSAGSGSTVLQQEEDAWPTLNRVVPRKAMPSESITIYGTNFKANVTTVRLNSIPCDSTVLSDTEIVATLPSEEHFSSVEALGLFYRRFSVIVEDDRGYNAHIKDAIGIQVPFRGASTRAFFQELGISFAIVGIIAFVLLPLWGTCCFCWCKKVVINYEKKRTYERIYIK